MSHPHTLTIPLLKPGITVTPYQDDVSAPSPRFLLALNDRYFLVSMKARALIVALLALPANNDELEAGFEAEWGERLPAAHLLALVAKAVPEALLNDAPETAREIPFVISLTLLGPRIATRITGYLSWLFTPALALSLIVVFAAMHIMVLPLAMQQAHGAWTAREAVLIVSLIMLSGLIHELGHTAACRFFKCPHGAIGFGLYYIFPAWYADVTQAWRLAARQRAVVDLGGVYFQSIFLIAVDIYALSTGSPLALKLTWLITFMMLFTLNPVFKFDGYWLLSDLSGLHNLHQQVRRSSAALIGAMMGRRAPAVPTMRRGILYLYSVLSTCYFAYFAVFLGTELVRFPATLPKRLGASWQSVQTVSAESGWGAMVALAQFCGALLWPLIIIVGAIFFADKLRRSLLEIAAAVRMARGATNANDAALEKI